MVPRDVARFVRFACFAAVALSASRLPPGAPEAPPVLDLGGHGAKPLPPPLQDFVTRVARLTDEQRRNLDEGKPVSRLLEADPEHGSRRLRRRLGRRAPCSGYVRGASPTSRTSRRAAWFKADPAHQRSAAVSPTSPKLRVPRRADLAALLPRCRVGACETRSSASQRSKSPPDRRSSGTATDAARRGPTVLVQQPGARVRHRPPRKAGNDTTRGLPRPRATDLRGEGVPLGSIDRCLS